MATDPNIDTHMRSYLSQPATVSALGLTFADTMQALYTSATSPLKPETEWVKGKTLYTGRPAAPPPALPANTPAQFDTHNNRLMWHAASQLDERIQHARTTYGGQRIGVIIGTTTTGVDDNYPAFDAFAREGTWNRDLYRHEYQLLSAPADFLAHHYDLSGPVYSISTACTSGARAIITAHRLLSNNICDAVICGGVDSLARLTINGFDSLQALSAGLANPFSANRDGINIGEAAALFVMTRNEQDGLPLLGYGNSADAWHMSSPDPKANGAILAIAEALSRAGVQPADIGWINLHGTATELNDSMESLALAICFPQGVPCTSTKPLTGHTLGAAGALEAALLWGVIDRGFNPAGALPAQLWDGRADPAVAPIKITDKTSRWQMQRRLGMSLSFAFGGNNAVLILGEHE